ncbi:hypothetical protein ACFVMC_12680 [Nocardia sp. NPDC127579]|uniref:hypothetical protein n=1 Tax=Nocardia sp. NPDC127579 TaxID=3345402 RepID=UPI00363A77AA
MTDLQYPQLDRIRSILRALGLTATAVSIAVLSGCATDESADAGFRTPHSAAEAFADGKPGDSTLICKSDLDKANLAGWPKSRLASVDVASNGEKGTFTVDVPVTADGGTSTQSFTYDLVMEDGGWKVCGLLG